MTSIERVARFRNKPASEKLQAVFATLGFRRVSFLFTTVRHRKRVRRALDKQGVVPAIRNGDELFLSCRPASDVTFRRHPEISQLCLKWVSHNLENNAGDGGRLYALVFNIKQLLEENTPGDLAELGVYRGNSAAILAHYARLSGKQLFLFDTFDGFDPRDLVGIDELQSRQFGDSSLAQVRSLVGNEGVEYIVGRFPDTLTNDLKQRRFCLVHVDCDLYEPAKAALEFFYPRLSPGGLMVLHDYANPFWEGMRKAVDEFCATIPERLLIFPDRAGTAMFRKSIT